MPLVPYVITYLLGAATGATATYFGNKYTDQRHRKEAASETQQMFRDLDDSMPDLISALRQGLQRPGWESVREFFVLPCKGVLAGSSRRRFTLYEDEIPDLVAKIGRLEEHSLVSDVTPKSVPVFRMNELFVSFLRR